MFENASIRFREPPCKQIQRNKNKKHRKRTIKMCRYSEYSKTAVIEMQVRSRSDQDNAYMMIVPWNKIPSIIFKNASLLSVITMMKESSSRVKDLGDQCTMRNKKILIEM